MITPDTALAQHRITRLATQLPVHRAFHWLHLHQPQLLQWQLEMLAIPAPPFAEHARASWFLSRFSELGLAEPPSGCGRECSCGACRPAASG